jgi:hypothetical protein
MNKTFTSLVILLFCGLNVHSQQSTTKSFTIEKKAVIDMNGNNDAWSPMLKNQVLPKPDDGADEEYAAKVRDDLMKQYARNRQNNSGYKIALVDTPIMFQNFTGNAFNNFVPNDNDMAISNSGILCSVANTTVWSRNTVTNQVHGSYNLHTLTSTLGLQQEEFDPKIIYDPVANRFIAIFLNGFTDSTSNMLVGFSQTDSSWGAWNFYALPGNPLSDTSWSDFPMAAITNNELFITVNLLYNDSTWQAGFRQTVIWQVNKNEGYTGASLSPQLHYGINYNGNNIRNLCPVKGGSQSYGPDMHFLSNRNFAASNDTLFLVHITDTINAAGQTLTVNPVISNINYHMPVYAVEPFVDLLAVNDARVMSAFIENNRIQFVFSCLDTASGKDCIFYGIADSSASGWSITGNLHTHPVRDLAYPNISYAGNSASDNRAIIVLLYSAAAVAPGTGAVLFDGISQFSSVATVQAGQTYINMLAGGPERWGDYSGSQRKYNQPGIVWVSGGYCITNHQTRTWIAELSANSAVAVAENPKVETTASLFPNPAAERVTVAFNNPRDQFLTFEVYDAGGRSVQQLFRGAVSKGENEFSFSAESLTQGIYFLKISGGSGTTVLTEKFVKEQGN